MAGSQRAFYRYLRVLLIWCMCLSYKRVFLCSALAPSPPKKKSHLSPRALINSGCAFATLDMKGRLFGCLDAVGVDGRGACKAVSEVSLRPR